MKKTLAEAANHYMYEDDRSFEPFIKAYFHAALWSSNDDNDEPLDDNYSMSDIADESYKKLEDEATKFENENKELYTKGGWDDEQAGHDFWLTRNGHGAGFWDRSSSDGFDEEIGKQLTDIAEKYGEVNLYIGDDGKIHA